MAKYGALEHPKTLNLAEALNIDDYAALGIIEALSHWCLKYAPRGDVGKFSNRRIAEGIHWRRKPDELISALVQSEFLDEVSEADGRLWLHNIWEHATDYHRKTLERAGLGFCNGSGPREGQVGRPKTPKAPGSESGQNPDNISTPREIKSGQNLDNSRDNISPKTPPDRSGVEKSGEERRKGTGEETLASTSSGARGKKGEPEETSPAAESPPQAVVRSDLVSHDPGGSDQESAKRTTGRDPRTLTPAEIALAVPPSQRKEPKPPEGDDTEARKAAVLAQAKKAARAKGSTGIDTAGNGHLRQVHADLAGEDRHGPTNGRTSSFVSLGGDPSALVKAIIAAPPEPPKREHDEDREVGEDG